MDLWFTEKHTKNAGFSIKVDRQLYSGKSEFQRIDIFESPEFGRFLTIDGYMMLTEKDEFIYHEMIVHVPMCVNPDAKRILVIGGGDGGTVRELLRYPAVERIDLVEIGRPALHPPARKRVRSDPRRFDRSVRSGRRALYEGVLRQLLQGLERGWHHGQPA